MIFLLNSNSHYLRSSSIIDIKMAGKIKMSPIDNNRGLPEKNLSKGLDKPCSMDYNYAWFR